MQNGWVKIARDITGLSESAAFQRGAIRAIVSRDGPERLWHISISHPSRYPSWEEIKSARYTLCPNDVIMVMFLPPVEEYINLSSNCFHLSQLASDERVIQP